jgi:hypothetical protein
METLVLTFAEIAFILRSKEPENIPVRERLRIEEPTDAVVAAGLSSLLARRLCTRDGEEVRPAPVIMAVAAGLSTTRVAIRAAGRAGDRTVLVHLFRGPITTVAISPAEFGQFAVELLDQNVELVDQLSRFLDASIADGTESVVLLEATGERDFSLAVARDVSGTWFLSDTLSSPDHGSVSSRDAALARIGELFGSPLDRMAS